MTSDKEQAVAPSSLAFPRRRRTPRVLVGAGLCILLGLGLWQMPLGDPWIHASYDYLFLFSARTATNPVVLVEMDDYSSTQLGQSRRNWARGTHAKLLDLLRQAGSPLTVMDIHFDAKRDDAGDETLEKAIRAHGRVILASVVEQGGGADVAILSQKPPLPRFAQVALTNGIAKVNGTPGALIRQHWPYPAPMPGYPSLAWVAAEQAGAASLPSQPVEQWIRYYGSPGPYEKISYAVALQKPAEHFRGKLVFVANRPAQMDATLPESDKFLWPYSRWTGEAVGGVECLIAECLNLLQGDWLRRWPAWIEFGLLCLTGGGFAWGLSRLRPALSASLTAGAMALLSVAAVLLSHYSHYWFPWLLIVGAQLPAAFLWSWTTHAAPQPQPTPAPPPPAIQPGTLVLTPDDLGQLMERPDTKDYEFFAPPFGEGAFGKVWVVRNSIGQFQALKAVYRSKFGSDERPYEMEFKGIKRFKPISSEHPGLLRVDFVSRQKDADHFFYVMELGDAAVEGWEQNPVLYRPYDLHSLAQQAANGRLPLEDCIQIGLSLSDALEFLHEQGFVHRDIKPSNIIFVKGRPKLADVGLVTEVRIPADMTSFAGTDHYMPPPPEPPGTIQGDIHALGKVLYVISTGRDVSEFPSLPGVLETTPAEEEKFLRLHRVIQQACERDCTKRFSTARELHSALLKLLDDLGSADLAGGGRAPT